MDAIDAIGWALLLLGIGAAIGVLMGYGRGFQVYVRQLREHDRRTQSLYQPTLDENERLKVEVNTLGARLEEMARENMHIEQTLEEWAGEITGLHHALDARSEADYLGDEEEREDARKRRRERRNATQHTTQHTPRGATDTETR